MGKLNKGILLPVIAFVLAKIQQYFGIAPFPDGTAEIIADIALGVITLYGLFMNAWKHRKQPEAIIQIGGGEIEYPRAQASGQSTK